ncbi:MAG TPA: hypothetical protein VLJ41_06360, partial [Segetibacter sp.]|nr:hypothetical protein [Segetibacter sp.]
MRSKTSVYSAFEVTLRKTLEQPERIFLAVEHLGRTAECSCITAHSNNRSGLFNKENIFAERGSKSFVSAELYWIID